jgi:predicted nuclease with TOPRIM domain
VSTVAVGWVAVRELASRTALHERIAHLEDQNAALRDEQQRLEDQQQRLEAERERLRGENPGPRRSRVMSVSSEDDSEGGEGPGRVAGVVTQGAGPR